MKQINNKEQQRIQTLFASGQITSLDKNELQNLRGGEWVLERYVDENGEIKYRYVYR